ncbi:transcription elongation factor GreA [Mycoplasmopsis agassizii]|uniref:Transcription elongation factor GreA n=1 Tax=Mycoplasmopsis agassizii TaxID=33922 RepID=A0ABX4H4G4_9BACT|nr:transcription elongation factor GreA [Mycoplasmopsis agassizii]PAF54673.1 transcription elongation factor GreA [Mycoplasmopsis agassizii]SMC16088.1 transcription elongation factor GreA [Mycoplasmopsis agassizii]
MSEIIQDNNKIFLTKETLQLYKKELDHLIRVERPRVIEEIKDARSQGDLSENAEYDAAREQQGIIEDRISELENIISRAEIIKSNNTDSIGIGSTVKFKNLTTSEVFEIKIVGPLDADPFNNLVSFDSPLALSLKGANVGDTVEIDAPTKYNTQILAV